MVASSLFLQFLFIPFALVYGITPTSKSHSQPPTLTRRAASPVSTICGEIIQNNTLVFPAKYAYDCLTSVPFNAAVATKFLKYYNDTLQFQSTLSYLKNPPASYQQPAVDLIGGLEEIQQAIDMGKYANEYEFESALQTLIIASHDDHLNVIAGIMGIFTFGSLYNIVSVSLDGVQLPKVYFSDDILNSQSDGTWQPSAITKINGVDVTEYLQGFASTNAIGSLEPHADFNQLMTSPAQDIQSIFSTWGGGATFYPGDELTFTQENGTQIDSRWFAVYNYPQQTGPLATGGDFYNFFVLGFYPASFDPDSSDDDSDSSSAASATAAASTSAASSSAAADQASNSWDNLAYPDPDVAQDDLGTFGTGFVSGYFLKQSSIAVLSLPSFQEPGSAIGTFSSAVTTFLSQAKAAGMQKVVVDVQQNYGGDVFLAIDTFKQFFPTIEPYGGSRMRAHSAANVMGDSITAYWDSLDDTFDDWDNFYEDEWVASTRINANTNRLFASWSEFFGPDAANGDSFTTIQRYNLSDDIFSTLSTGDDDDNGFEVYGEEDRPANTTQPYAAEDIVILSDGLCSSSCALFMEMMHIEAGVRTIVAGGLPYYGPMQTPSMSRGAAEYGTDILDERIGDAQQLLQDNNDPRQDFLPNRTEALDISVIYADINLRDQIRQGGDTPIQFLYEAATCRIFYTPETFYNYTALWTYAANAMWKNSSLCVQGSTGYSTTNATSVTGPPSSVVPPATTPTTDPKIGSIIMSMLGSDDGTQDAPILDSGVPKNKDIQGQACPDGFCDNSGNYFCLKTSKCNTTTGHLVPTTECVKICPPHTGRKDCGNSGFCQPLNETVPGFKISAEHESLKGKNGFCNPPAPACSKATKKPSTLKNPGSAHEPGEKRHIQLF